MARSAFKHTKITGISVVVPDEIVSIDDELEYFNNNSKMLAKAKMIVGYGTRHIAPENCTPTDLCEAAARKLISDMGIDINGIDAIVAVISKPDFTRPGAACVLHGRLNLPESCAAFDVNHGCAGYNYGLWLVSSLIDGGACKKVLMVAGDKDSSRSDTNRIVRHLFGDAGSATLLEYSAQDIPSFYNAYADGKGYHTLITPAGGHRIKIGKDVLDLVITDQNDVNWKLTQNFMDGMAVFNFTMTEVPPSIADIMDYAGYSFDDIDFFALHQANKQIVSTIASKLNIPSDKYSAATFTKYGNKSTASLPGVISHLLKDKVTNGKQRLLLSGFGIGLTWSAAVVELDHIYCSGMVVQNFDHIRSREEEIKFWTDRIAGRGK